MCGGCTCRYVVFTSLTDCYKYMISWKRTLKYMVGQVDRKIEQYCADLFCLRNGFLARATVTTEVAVLEAGA
jgi:hypothetical protein